MCTLIKEVFAQVADLEIIVIDDGSKVTESLLRLSELENAKLENLKVIRNHQNLGYGATLKIGIDLSSNNYIAFMDSDESYSVEDLLKLFNFFIDKKASMVVGVRRGRHYRGRISKILFRFLLIRLAEYMSRSKIPDINSGIRVLNKNHFHNFLRLASNKFSFTTSLTLISLQKGYPTFFESVGYHKRKGFSHVRMIRDGFTAVGQILAISMFFNPLRVFFLIFQMILALNFMLLSFSILRQSSIYALAGVTITLTVLFLAVGLIAHLIKDLFYSTPNEPS
jgi:glycosyltransferase involved in cell wall biosynthesis